MNYLSKFDSSGKRIASYPLDDMLTEDKKDELIADGYIEIDEDEWNYYVGNKGAGDNGTGYVRKGDKPVSAPAYVPTAAEKVAALDNQYETNKKTLASYYLDAALAGDTDVQDALKDEMTALNAQYDTALAEIKGGE